MGLQVGTILRVSAVLLSVGLLIGCASNEKYDEIKAMAEEAKQTAAEANGNAQQAQDTANRALQTAEEAKSMSEETNAKVDQMFKKSMYK